ncbi:MAG: glycosyltransferase family 39 protein [Candidatus Latescibacterota bacterium]|jgi:4-amino-4-deoxy-L-arabinose transferase-like glycosyltransferase
MAEVAWPRVLVLALAVRAALPLAVFWATGDLSTCHARDTSGYLGPAIELLANGRFQTQDHPEILRTPGYSLLLIPGILLGHLEAVTVALQVACSGLTVLLIWKSASLLTDRPGAGLAAGCLYALEPLSVIYASKLLSETLFTALLILSLYLLLRYLRSESTPVLAGAGAALSAAVYVRPVGYLLPVLVFAVLLARWWRRRASGRRPLWQTLLFLGLCASALGAWQARNAVVAEYRGFAAVTAVNAYFYYGAAVLAAEEGVPYRQMQERLGYRDDEVYLARHPEQRGWSQAERYRFLGREGTRLALSRPLLCARICLQGLVRVVLDPGGVELLRLFGQYPESGGMLGAILDRGLVEVVRDTVRQHPEVGWVTLGTGVPLGICLILATVALLGPGRLRGAPVACLVTAAGYLLLASAGPLALDRFRHPVMPILCLLAGHAAPAVAAALRARWSGLRSRIPAAGSPSEGR